MAAAATVDKPGSLAYQFLSPTENNRTRGKREIQFQYTAYHDCPLYPEPRLFAALTFASRHRRKRPLSYFTKKRTACLYACSDKHARRCAVYPSDCMAGMSHAYRNTIVAPPKPPSPRAKVLPTCRLRKIAETDREPTPGILAAQQDKPTNKADH